MPLLQKRGPRTLGSNPQSLISRFQWVEPRHVANLHATKIPSGLYRSEARFKEHSFTREQSRKKETLRAPEALLLSSHLLIHLIEGNYSAAKHLKPWTSPV